MTQMSQAAGAAQSDVREIEFLGMPVRSHQGEVGQVNEFAAQAGPIAPPHRHAWAETHYVLEGEIEYMVAGETHRVGAGGFLTIAGNTVHAVSALSPVRWVEFTAPSGPADFFAEVSAHSDLDPTQMEGMQRIGEIAARYEVELLLG
jgi:quercetin dioxygenase-like cupin family protein